MNELGQYNGISIQYHAADDTFVNATQMCQATGKRWGNYWRNESTQEFVAALAENMQCSISHIVNSQVGGDRTGTWVHRRVAIHLAQWCSADFAVWVTEKMEQLLTTGKVVIHREHQEAELALAPMIHQTLMEVRKSNEISTQAFQASERSYIMCLDTLKMLQQRSPDRLESVVESELVKAEGGLRQCEIAAGHRIDVIIPGEWAIEIKYWKDYKAAVGQITLYDIYLDAELERRVHLFWKPLDKGPTETKRLQIEKECRRKGITVTWHEWKLEPKKNQQQLLPITY